MNKLIDALLGVLLWLCVLWLKVVCFTAAGVILVIQMLAWPFVSRTYEVRRTK